MLRTDSVFGGEHLNNYQLAYGGVVGGDFEEEKSNDAFESDVLFTLVHRFTVMGGLLACMIGLQWLFGHSFGTCFRLS